MLEAAIRYAEQGWRIFPVSGKIPVTSHGVLDATSSLDQVRSWWGTTTSLGIARAMGSGTVVLDIDPKNGGSDSLAGLESKYGRLPDTLRVVTPSGGEHHYFSTSEALGNARGSLPVGIDIRGDGGYVVLPPSPGYLWDIGSIDVPVQMPEWLLSMLRERPRTAVSEPVRVGNRNQYLTSIAGTIRRRPDITLEGFIAALEGINSTFDTPLDRGEVEQVARSVFRYEPVRTGRGEGSPVSGNSVQRGQPAGTRLPSSGPFRRPGQPRGFFTGAGYLGRRR